MHKLWVKSKLKYKLCVSSRIFELETERKTEGERERELMLICSSKMYRSPNKNGINNEE